MDFFRYLSVAAAASSESASKMSSSAAASLSATGAVDTISRAASWFCRVRDVRKLYADNPTYLAVELLLYFICTLTLIHAHRHGTRYRCVWVGILIHALQVETVVHLITDLDTFWYAQGIITLFGGRVPLSMIFGVYHACIYTSYVFAERMYLPTWASGPAVGLGTVVLSMPLYILGTKLIWWSWHDSDPNAAQRLYWVPWLDFIFHATACDSFTWVLRLGRRLLRLDEGESVELIEQRGDKCQRCGLEFLACFVAGISAFWLGVWQLGIFYHPLYHFFDVSAEVIVLAFLFFYALIVYIGDRRNPNAAAHTRNAGWRDELALAVCLYHAFFMTLVLFANPKLYRSEGFHQPMIGAYCNSTLGREEEGLFFKRKKYLCAERYGEAYFDFHCLPGGKAEASASRPLDWYTICGVDFVNRAEYVVLIWAIGLLSSVVFYQAAARSGRTPMAPALKSGGVPYTAEDILRPSENVARFPLFTDTNHRQWEAIAIHSSGLHFMASPTSWIVCPLNWCAGVSPPLFRKEDDSWQ